MGTSVILDDYVGSGDFYTIVNAGDRYELAGLGFLHSTDGRVFLATNTNQSVETYVNTMASSGGLTTIYFSDGATKGHVDIEGSSRNINEDGSVLKFYGAEGNIHVHEQGDVFATGDRGIGISLAAYSASTYSNVINDGIIYGYNAIVRTGSEGAVITNNGTIQSGGGAAYIDNYGSSDIIYNNGTIVGKIDFGGGNDSYQGIDGTSLSGVFGGDGFDWMNGGTGSDYFNGGSGHDELHGNGGTDTLDGGSDADLLDGGIGADTMLGGAGNDTYYLDNVGDIVDESVVGSDGADAVVSALAVNLSDAIHFKGAIESAVLTGAGNVNLTGNGLGNVLIGNPGNNVINGGAGADNMRGMAGNDTYYVDNANDIVDEIAAGSGGTDWVVSALAINLSGAAHFKGSIEAVLLTGATNVNAIGNGLGNVLTGNAGSNVIDGLLGNDRLTGGAGADAFLFNTALNPATNVDTITDFSAPADTIWLENAIFTGLATTGVLAAGAFVIGTAASDGNDRIIYNNANGWLSYDADGSGGGAAIHFATLSTHPAITNADFVVV